MYKGVKSFNRHIHGCFSWLFLDEKGKWSGKERVEGGGM